MLARAGVGMARCNTVALLTADMWQGGAVETGPSLGFMSAA